jgi:DNA-binding NarL/FixJ family response regulator
MGRARVLIADDHALIAEAFRRLLEPKFEVIGAATDGRELLQLALKTKPDVILLDLVMPNLDGFQAGQQVKKLLPSTKIVVVTMSEDGYVADAALREWASGYITKASAGQELLRAIGAAISGNRYIAPKIADRHRQRFIHNPRRPQPRSLTHRQREVLQLLAGGRSMKQAAAELQIAARTIAFHKYTIMREYGLRTNFDLLRFAVQQDITPPRDVRPEAPTERESR